MTPGRIAKVIDGGRDYPGAKGGAGIAERIINQMPPHDLYIEAFAGSAQVWRRKLPAAQSILIDSDSAVAGALARIPGHDNTVIYLADAVTWLRRRHFKPGTVIYCDPPYPDDTLKRPGRRYYRATVDHNRLLAVLRRLTVPVLLSGYRCDLYDGTLATWRRIDYRAITRGGSVQESLWCNFEPPFALHDYRFLGQNFREREKINRRKKRWRARLEKMTPLERGALLDTLKTFSPVVFHPGQEPAPGGDLGASPQRARRIEIEQYELPHL